MKLKSLLIKGSDLLNISLSNFSMISIKLFIYRCIFIPITPQFTCLYLLNKVTLLLTAI